MRCFAVAAVVSLVISACTLASDLDYNPTLDPRLGMNLWDPYKHTEDAQRISREVEAMHAAGLHEVVLTPFAYTDMTTGQIQRSWLDDNFGSMTDLELANGIVRAKQLGMQVTVTPFVQIRNQGAGRDQINFTTATSAGQTFWNNYRDQYVQWAALAQAAGADKFNVGSEMAGLDQNIANADSWNDVIAAVDAVFSGRIGYSSQHWHVGNAAMRSMIWSHPKIDYVSFSAYPTYQPEYGNPNPGMASVEQSQGNASDGAAFVQTVEANFTTFLDKMLLVGQSVNKPMVIGEFGVAPFDTASTIPYKWWWSIEPGNENYAPYDALEARNVWEGVLRALGGRKGDFESIAAWTWGWDGGFPAERFFLRPGATDIPWTDLDETQQNLVSEFLSAYASGTLPEPSSIAMLVFPLLALAKRKAHGS